MRTISIWFDQDYSKLGTNATEDDHEFWCESVALAVSQKFGVIVNSYKSSCYRNYSDDPEVTAWLRELCAGDDWIDHLP